MRDGTGVMQAVVVKAEVSEADWETFCVYLAPDESGELVPRWVASSTHDAEGDAVDARLLDFGLAQMQEFDTLTAIGDVPGTLAYVSPERLLGKEATPAADVWAVGVILWEALTGTHPFRTDSVGETSRRIQAGAPDLAGRRPDLPEGLRRTVASAPSPQSGSCYRIQLFRPTPGGAARRTSPTPRGAPRRDRTRCLVAPEARARRRDVEEPRDDLAVPPPCRRGRSS